MKTKCPNCKHEFDVSLPRRSVKQNNAYWGIIIPTLSDHFGYFPEEMHEELKVMFNPKDSKINIGEKFGGSTTNMTTKDFMSYCEQIILWACIEHGIEIPEINEKQSIPEQK